MVDTLKVTANKSGEIREKGASLTEVLIGIVLTLLIGIALFSFMESYYRTQSIDRQLSIRTSNIAIMKEALEHTVALNGYCGATTAALNSAAEQEIGLQVPGLLGVGVNLNSLSTTLTGTVNNLNTFLFGGSNPGTGTGIPGCPPMAIPQVTAQTISVTWAKMDPQTGSPVSCTGTFAAQTNGVAWTISSPSSLCSPGVAFYPVGAGWSFRSRLSTQCMGYVGNGPANAIVATQSGMAAVVAGTSSTRSAEVTVCLPNS
jgi:hypothetical protein